MINLPANNVKPETINGFLNLNDSDVAKCIQVGRSTSARGRLFLLVNDRKSLSVKRPNQNVRSLLPCLTY